MLFHLVMIFGVILLVAVASAIDGNLKRIADALVAQNAYYGIFEQTSEEQETAAGV